jgi:hypothetical protein
MNKESCLIYPTSEAGVIHALLRKLKEGGGLPCFDGVLEPGDYYP